MLLIGHVRTRGFLICMQAGECGRKMLQVFWWCMPPWGLSFGNFRRCFFWTFTSNWESQRPQFRFYLNSRNQQIIGNVDLAPKQFTSILAQGGLGDAEELALTQKRGFIWLVLNSFSHVAAHSPQVSREFRLSRRSRCDCIPAVRTQTERPTFVSGLWYSLGDNWGIREIIG